MKRTSQPNSVDATFKQCLELMDRLERCADQLRKLLPVAGNSGEYSRQAHVRRSRRGELDRFQWGCTVANSLAPKFNSREFSRVFRAALPLESLQVFDPVRLKKVLQLLCREQVIEMTKAGRGRTPAHYRVLPRARS